MRKVYALAVLLAATMTADAATILYEISGTITSIIGDDAASVVSVAVSDSWSATSTFGAPAPRRGHTAIWTGTEILVWGGIILLIIFMRIICNIKYLQLNILQGLVDMLHALVDNLVYKIHVTLLDYPL